MKKFYVNYSLLGSGTLVVMAKNIKEVEEIVWRDITDEILKRETDFKRGLSIEGIEDDLGNYFEQEEIEDMELNDDENVEDEEDEEDGNGCILDSEDD